MTIYDSPEVKLIYAISGQAISDMVSAAVRLNWTDSSIAVDKATIEAGLRFLRESSPFAEDDRWEKLIRDINEEVLPREIAKDRLGRLRSYKADVKREEKILQEIEALERSRGEVKTYKAPVQATQREFPYVSTRVTVDIYDPAELDRINKKIAHKRKDLERIERKLEDVRKVCVYLDGELSEAIKDIYIRGTKKQGEAAKELGISAGRLSQRVNEALIEYAREWLKPIKSDC